MDDSSKLHIQDAHNSYPLENVWCRSETVTCKMKCGETFLFLKKIYSSKYNLSG